MRALPFRRDRAMASTSGIGSGSPTYGRDGSETVHRRHRPSRHHHGRCACSSSVVSRATSAWSRPGRRSTMARSSSNMMATSRAMQT